MPTRSHVPCSNYIWDNICLFVCKHYSAFCRSSYFFSFELSLGGYASPVVLFFTHWSQVIFVIFCRFFRFPELNVFLWELHVAFSAGHLLELCFFAAVPVSSLSSSLFRIQGVDFLKKRENINFFLFSICKNRQKNLSHEKMLRCTYTQNI